MLRRFVAWGLSSLAGLLILYLAAYGCLFWGYPWKLRQDSWWFCSVFAPLHGLGVPHAQELTRSAASGQFAARWVYWQPPVQNQRRDDNLLSCVRGTGRSAFAPDCVLAHRLTSVPPTLSDQPLQVHWQRELQHSEDGDAVFVAVVTSVEVEP